MKTKDTEVLGR